MGPYITVTKQYSDHKEDLCCTGLTSTNEWKTQEQRAKMRVQKIPERLEQKLVVILLNE